MLHLDTINLDSLCWREISMGRFISCKFIFDINCGISAKHEYLLTTWYTAIVLKCRIIQKHGLNGESWLFNPLLFSPKYTSAQRHMKPSPISFLGKGTNYNFTYMYYAAYVLS